MIDPSELRAAIRATSAFRDLSEAKVSFLIEAGELQAFEPAAILMVQGEPSDSVVLILTGEVIVTSDSARGVIPVSTMQAPCCRRDRCDRALAALGDRARAHGRDRLAHWTRRACRSRTLNTVHAHRRHWPHGRSPAQGQWRDWPLHARAGCARASRVRPRFARRAAQPDP